MSGPLKTASLVAANRARILRALQGKTVAPELVDSLARRANAEKTVARINALVAAGVPLKGLVFKTSMSEKQFSELMRGHKTGMRFTQAQQDIFDFLTKKCGLDEARAKGIARQRGAAQMMVIEKVKYFRSIKLDPQRYGVATLPISSFAHMLPKSFELIKRGIKKQVLWKVEDAHAEKLLDQALPNWRNVRNLSGITVNGKKKRRRPAVILAKIREFERRGIPLRSDYLYGSIERAKKNSVAQKKKRTYKKLLAGTRFDPIIQKRNAKRIRAIEEELIGVNEMIDGRNRGTVDYHTELEPLLTRRNALVRERNQLLFGK